MKKHLFILPLLGVLAPGCSYAAPITTELAAAPKASIPAPVWSPRSDGFAATVIPDRNGTTGGAGGRVVTTDNLADLGKYASSSEPLVILVKGAIAKELFGKHIQVASNKTFLGLSPDATILHGEFNLRNVSNVIIRNLTIRGSRVPTVDGSKGPDYDGVQIDDSHHIWIDHCNITHMHDGLIDYRKASDYLTVSWCILSDQNKAFGVGWTDEVGKLRLTMHHTWIHDTTQRNPSFANGTGHLYNNWLQNIASYGNYSRGKAKVVVENSVFEKVNNPLQRDVEAELVSRGNVLTNCTTSEDQKNPAQGEAFDPKSFYAYSLDDAARVPDLLSQYAGPQASIGTPEMAELMAKL